MAKTTPAHTAVARPVKRLVNTRDAGAATPIATQLGTRDQNSVGGNSANQPCIIR